MGQTGPSSGPVGKTVLANGMTREPLYMSQPTFPSSFLHMGRDAGIKEG